MSEDVVPQTLIVVSGVSGSGKSVALKTFEDLGFYCVDNLPAELLPDFVRGVARDDGMPEKLAVGIDIRSRSDLANLPQWLSAVGALGLDPKLVFFDTRDEVLLKRYADTRRRHPLSHLGLALADAISLERQVLKPMRTLADVVIDTSTLNVHQLRRQVITEFGLGSDATLSLLFESFAYRRGVPADADFVFDARGLPNPHWNARAAAVVRPRLRGARVPGDADRSRRIHRPGLVPSSTPGCRGCSPIRAATSRSRSAAPADGIARYIWPSASRNMPASVGGRKWRFITASWIEILLTRIDDQGVLEMDRFVWIPGRGMDASALERLRSHFSRPAKPMGEAWFMGSERRMFNELLNDLDGLSAYEIQKPLEEIASGTSAFGPLDEWTSWYHYLLGALLPRSHEHFVDYVLEYLITGFMALHPNGIQQPPYEGFREDVLMSLGSAIMDDSCWNDSDIAIGKVLHRSDNNPARVWCWWDASGTRAVTCRRRCSSA